jgi:hypothetical protein
LEGWEGEGVVAGGKIGGHFVRVSEAGLVVVRVV